MNRNKRDHIPQWKREAIIAAQSNTCYYCGVSFGETVMRNGKPTHIKAHIDHVVPWSMGGRNTPGNLVAACNVCNSIKSARTFSSVESCREFVLTLREQKGYVAPAQTYQVPEERKKAILNIYSADKSTAWSRKTARDRERDARELAERQKIRAQEKDEKDFADLVRNFGKESAERTWKWILRNREESRIREQQRNAERKELARLAKLGSVTRGNG
jgi:hypothetical protein